MPEESLALAEAAAESSSTGLQQLLTALEQGDTLECSGLRGSAAAYLLAHWLQLSRQRLVLVFPEEAQARSFHADLCAYMATSEQPALYPAWEPDPFTALSPHPEVQAQRLAVLAALGRKQVQALVTSVPALMQKVLPWEDLKQHLLLLEAEAEWPRPELTRRLTAMGYHHVPLVEEKGTYAVRGGIVDVYPADALWPVRLEFFGDWIERLRPFDPVSQRSHSEELRALSLTPARELLLGQQINDFAHRLKECCDNQGLQRPQREAVLTELESGIVAPGREFLLPLNHEQLIPLSHYIPDFRLVLWEAVDAETTADSFAELAATGAQNARQRGEPCAGAEPLYLDTDSTLEMLRQPGRICINSLQLYDLQQSGQRYQPYTLANSDLRLGQEGIARLHSQLLDWVQQDWAVVLTCRQLGEAKRLQQLLAPYDWQLDIEEDTPSAAACAGQLSLVVSPLTTGFRWPQEKLALITSEELFGHKQHRRRKKASKKALTSSLALLQEGDYVVHVDYGIGRYRGLQHMDTGSQAGDFLLLEYAEGDKLYLPVDRIAKVHKYQGGDKPRIQRMGSQAWDKAKAKAKAAVEELAQELLQFYARRRLNESHTFKAPDAMYQQFEAAFPYEETPDQQAAIDDVLADMQSGQPMDRLICGDVGYGKTEVALRAAFKAVQESKQVAVLVPTTVLAQQHYETFKARLQDFPVTVDLVSRFRSSTAVKETLQQLRQGQVDIIIGTHRLLQQDVRFKDLGLVIVDEEQRFGVSHKERLKRYRAEVAMLTLTATPIPRTLNMSLSGLRDLSVIETPPVDRLAVRTYVARFADELVRDAIRRELQRQGQVFFVHNQVQTIDAMAHYLRQLVPEASIAVGHGQMPEKELEKVMLDFMEGRSQVLVCSTIIENGLDIPRANTILINRADHFGLAQLYQLRGRVGRSHVRGYAYLLVPGEAGLTSKARSRLQVLQELSQLGAGFQVANHDLELRGAGDLLGGRQAGQMAAVGYELYNELLEEAVAQLQGQPQASSLDPELRLGVSAYLPEGYVPDPNQRLVLYKRLAQCDNDDEFYELWSELQDRFGPLPPEGERLLEVMKIRMQLKRLRIEAAEYQHGRLALRFCEDTPLPPDAILARVQANPDNYQFTPDYRLLWRLQADSEQQFLETITQELDALLNALA